jgi:hypothetical protein
MLLMRFGRILPVACGLQRIGKYAEQRKRDKRRISSDQIISEMIISHAEKRCNNGLSLTFYSDEIRKILDEICGEAVRESYGDKTTTPGVTVMCLRSSEGAVGIS